MIEADPLAIMQISNPYDIVAYTALNKLRKLGNKDGFNKVKNYLGSDLVTWFPLNKTESWRSVMNMSFYY